LADEVPSCRQGKAFGVARAQVAGSGHHAGKVGDLLRAIDGYQGQFATCCALKLAPLVFARPDELRRAEWAELDLDGAEWRIPAHKMKMREVHTVPLANR